MKKVIFLLLTLFLVACSDTTQKAESPKNLLESTIHIYNDYDEALTQAKEQKKSLFILFSTQHCPWCKRLKDTTLQDPELLKRLKNEFIVLFLDKDDDDYPFVYEVEGVPSVFMVGENENIYTTQMGYRENPRDYIKWFDYIKIENESK